VLAILLNAGMYFGGVRTNSWVIGAIGKISFSPYDLIVGFVAFLLLVFFFVTAIQETIRLAKADQ
jgi:DMSO/TMAO reductase YedYZ heme-binding membrane subunit